MDRWVGKIAIVTGASAGIGEAVSKALVEKGVNVLGLARREDKLKELENSLQGYKGTFYCMKCDVRNEKEVINAFTFAEEKFGGVDILINNAGIVRVSRFEYGNVEDFRDVLEVNVLAAAVCTREAINSLRKSKKEGHIININSVLGRNAKGNIITPYSLYPASKFALRAMTDTIRLEIEAEQMQIRMTSIYPGLVKTEIYGTVDDFETVTAYRPSLDSSHIADSIIYVISAPLIVQIEDLVITPLHNLM